MFEDIFQQAKFGADKCDDSNVKKKINRDRKAKRKRRHHGNKTRRSDGQDHSECSAAQSNDREEGTSTLVSSVTLSMDDCGPRNEDDFELDELVVEIVRKAGNSDYVVRQEPDKQSCSSCERRRQRERQTSCDELKSALEKKYSSVRQSSTESKGRVTGQEYELGLRQNLKQGYGYSYRESTTSRLTDFERFVAENGDADFQEKCFPAENGEECALCEFKGTTNSTGSSSVTTTANDGDGGVNRKNGSPPKPYATGFNKRKVISTSSMDSHSEERDVKTLRSECKRARLEDGGGEAGSSDHPQADVSETPGPSSGASAWNESACLDRLIAETRDAEQQPVVDLENVTTAVCECTNPAQQSSPEQPSVMIPDSMYVALDCEMVGTGLKGKNNALARCSIVNYCGQVLYDRFIRPEEPITDYRTRWSGIRPHHMIEAESTRQALQDIHQLLSNKIIIGHSVYNDFRVLDMNPAFYRVRDTAQCKSLVVRAGLEGQGNSLKKLSAALLDRTIQRRSSGHCSVEDARASLDLFKLVRPSYEAELYTKWASKFNRRTMVDLADFVKRERTGSSIADGHFLQDKYWPEEILN